MHVQHVGGAAALVQVVDVLGNQRDAGAGGGELGLHFGERDMRRVRVHRVQQSATGVVEFPHAGPVAPPAFDGGDRFNIFDGPEAILVAKRRKAGTPLTSPRR